MDLLHIRLAPHESDALRAKAHERGQTLQSAVRRALKAAGLLDPDPETIVPYVEAGQPMRRGRR
jgi:hypothetical protein